MRDSAIIYRSFYEAIKELPKENQADIWGAICNFYFNETEPSFTGINQTVWILIQPVMLSNNKNWINGCKPKKSKTEEEANGKPKGSQKEAKKKPLRSGEEGYKDKDKDKDKDKEENKIPPVEVFLAYIQSKYVGEFSEIESSAKYKYQAFVENGWKDGNNEPIKNWKSKMLNIIPHLKKGVPNTKFVKKEPTDADNW